MKIDKLHSLTLLHFIHVHEASYKNVSQLFWKMIKKVTYTYFRHIQYRTLLAEPRLFLVRKDVYETI